MLSVAVDKARSRTFDYRRPRNMAKTKVGVTVIVILIIIAIATGFVIQEQAATSISLHAADALHERMNYEFSGVGTVALYQGALAYRMLGGITPTSYPGRWDVYPVEKITNDNGNYAPLLATQDDRLFSLEATSKSEGDVIKLIIKGEKISVSLRGVQKGWRFPRSTKMTVQALLEECSDDAWAKQAVEERKAAEQKRR